tara:strand:- start:92 stop:280 length:189 start_codon:yes stop_codon:yes gene_type:complete
MDQERLVKLETEISNLRDTQMKHLHDGMKDLERKVEKLDARIWYILVAVLATFVTVVLERIM